MLRFLVLIAVLGLAALLPGRTASAQTVTPPAQTVEPPPVSPAAEAERVAGQPALLGLPAATQDAIRRVTTTIDQLAADVEQARTRDDDLNRMRQQIDALVTEAQTLTVAIQPRLQAIRGQIEKLGPPPAKDAAPETPAVAEERSRLSNLAAEADGAVRTLGLSQLRAKQIVARMQELRQRNFTRDLFKRTTSPLRPSVWAEVFRELTTVAGDLVDTATNWWDRVAHRWGEVVAILAGGIVTWLVLGRVSRRLIDQNLQPPRTDRPSFFVRAGAAILVAPVAVAPLVVGAGAIYLGLDGLELLGLQVGLLAEGAIISFLTYAVVSGLTTATYATDRGCWRLFDLSDATAVRLARLTRFAALVYAVDLFVRHVIATLGLSLQMSVAVSLVTSIAFASFLLGIVRTRVERLAGSDTPVALLRPRWFKIPLAVISVAVVGAALLGFVALGRFIAGQVLLTGSVLVLLFLFHLAIRAATEMPIGAALDGPDATGEARRNQISTLVAVLLHVLLAALGLPLVLLTWGYAPPDIFDLLKALLFGFEIGQFRISLARIVIALVLFGAILIGTKFIQRWLVTSVLPTARLEAGVANSVQTALGYAGFALAALVAISYTGLDITNLAIVAGALSVGIGLGLQSIVNNFVSGLILLVERPIKVGDWIVLRDREGIVRRISVRSTEIETFDRASLIVPNSELVAATVLNWTHRNSVGRLTVKVGVTYAADPEQVIALLTEVAQKHPDVLQHPAPIIAFDNFGASSLDFSVRVFLADVMQSLRVQTELRVAIMKAFRSHGIEMPYPQTDVHLRDLDGLKSMLLGALKVRQQQAAMDRRGDDD